MTLKQFCINQKWCIGFVEVRRFISNNAIKVNDILITDANMELNNGDIVICGKHRAAVVEEN